MFLPVSISLTEWKGGSTTESDARQQHVFLPVSEPSDKEPTKTMSTARAYDRIIRRHLRRHAAWIPVVSPFEVGDYGFYDGGVFRQIGNIRSRLGIEFETKPGGQVSLDFQTRKGTEVTFFVEGRGEVPQLPDTDVEARIDFAFTGSRSFLLKAPVVTSTTMQDIAGVAAQISQLPRRSWRRRYKLVTEVLSAKEAVMVGTQTRNTTVSLNGKANILRQLDLGNVAAGVKVTANRDIGLRVEGESGSIALGLVRVSRRGSVGLESLRSSTESSGPTFETESNDDDLEVDDDF